MKSFLKYTLATMVGFILVIFFWFLIAVGIVSAIVASSDKETVLENNSVLEIKLDGEVVDRATDNPFENLDIPLLASTQKVGIDLLKESITKAKNEDKVKGIYLRIDDVSAGYAACEEIRSA